MSAGPPEIDPDLASRLRMSILRLARRLRQEAPEETTQSQLSVLAVLYRDGPMGIGTLAAAERVKPPTVTRIVDQLEARGLVSRGSDPRDGRCVVVQLTAAGDEFVVGTRRRRDAYLARRLASLDRADRDDVAAAVELLELLFEEDR